MFAIPVPLEVARIRPELEIRVADAGGYTVFGGLVAEQEAERRYLEKEYWGSGCANGFLSPRGSVLPDMAVPYGKTKVWQPDADALENIDCQALAAMGVGEVKWFGALGSESSPLHAGFRLMDGDWQQGAHLWSWRDAIEQLMAVAGINVTDPAFQQERRKAAIPYGESVLNEYRKIRRGEVFGVVVYVARPGLTRRHEQFDFEVWGHVGKDWAVQALNEAMANTASRAANPSVMH